MPVAKRRRVSEPQYSLNQAEGGRSRRSQEDATGKIGASSLYEGWSPNGKQLSSIQYSGITQREFWTSHVSTRRPVVLLAGCDNSDLAKLKCWTLAHLRDKAVCHSIDVFCSLQVAADRRIWSTKRPSCRARRKSKSSAETIPKTHLGKAEKRCWFSRNFWTSWKARTSLSTLRLNR